MGQWWEQTDASLIQGSSEWIKARQFRIGGSDIPSIMRLSPYKTRLDLWREKTGRVKPESISHLPHVKRGIDAEPIARAMIEAKIGVKYTTPTLKDKRWPFLVASLDGLCETHALEIKTMSKQKHEAVGEQNDIPDYYVAQCQWNMMIAGVPRLLFASYRPEDKTLHLVWLEAESSYQRQMRARALQFWRWVKRDIQPSDNIALDV